MHSKLLSKLIFRIADGLRSLREAMIWTVPVVLMFALFITCAYLLEVFQINTDWSSELRRLVYTLFKLVPLVITTSLTYILSVKKHLPPMPVTTLGLTCYLMVYLDPTKSFQSATSFMLLIGIVIPFVTTSLIGVLYENKWTMLTNSDLAGSNVKNALNLTVPGAILFVTIFFALKLIVYWMSFLDSNGFIDHVFVKASYPGGLIYTLLNSTLWFLGVHGGNVL